MTENLSPQQTREFRAGQKQRSRIILVIILLWIAGIFALTMVKGRLAVEQREAQQETATQTNHE
ncbi:MAG TPA: hypothetical protein PKW15_00020 [Alphaproteobacteria bacterium]|nr:hypothetical protein [Rhodospirillaceae bacterium]HRJ11610.1 hypothetical protein [Alphaproteobacteria bacterium]